MLSSLKNAEHHRILSKIHVGDLESIRNFHDSHPNLHWTDIRYEQTGDTVLHVAARNGHLNVVRYLLENFEPLAVDCRNNDNKTALHEACQFGSYEVAEYLLSAGADVNALKKSDWTPLMLACTKADTEKTVEILLQHNAGVNYQNKDGWTALHLICRQGGLKTFKILLENSADLRILTKNGRSALHIACLHGNFAIVSELLKEKLVDVNLKDSCGNTPLFDAILSENFETIEALIENGADVGVRNITDFSLLHFAACKASEKVVRYLVETMGFDVNLVNFNGLTALHCCARVKRKDIYDLLIGLGADPTTIDKFNRTAGYYLNL